MRLEPVISALQKEYGSHIDFIIADVYTPQGEALARQYNIVGLPTFAYFDSSGSLLQLEAGWRGEEPVREMLDSMAGR